MHNMGLYGVILTAVTTIAVAFSCWLVFFTASAVKFAQSLQGDQQSGVAYEPWYPMWLRFEGIWMWVMIAFFLSH